MNIMYINHYAGSPDMGMAFRIYYFAKEWEKMGHRVLIVAGDYSHLRRKNPDVNNDFQVQQIDDINYCWIKTGQYQGNGVKRAISMFKFVYKLFFKSKKITKDFKPDIVISSSTYPLDSFPAYKIAKKNNAKYIHEAHDLWPLTLTELGGMSKLNPFVVAMQIGENYAYKKAKQVVSLLPYTKEHMISHGMKPEKFVNIQSGIVLEEWDNPEDLPLHHKVILDKIHQDNNFVVGYFGGHAYTNALYQLVDIAEKLKGEKYAFVLVGDGVEKIKLMDYAKEKNLHNIYFLPPISKKAIPSLCKEFDCIYIGSYNSPLYRFGLCVNKMYDSMMSGKPILCALNAPNILVDVHKCGICVESENIQEAVNALDKLKNMTDNERLEMGAKGKQAVINNYNYRELAKRFEKLFY